MQQESYFVLVLWDEDAPGSLDHIHNGLSRSQDVAIEIVTVSFLLTETVQGLIEDSRKKGFEGIILFSSSEELLKSFEMHSLEHNVPIVTVSTTFSYDILSVHLGTCSFTAGALAAKEVIRYLNFKGTVLLMNMQDHNASYEEIADGFSFYIDSFAPEVILSRRDYLSGTDACVFLGAAPISNGCYTVSVSDSAEDLMLYQEGFINTLVHPNWEELAYESVMLMTHMLKNWTISTPNILPSRILAPE